MIYLDNNSTTHVDSATFEAMRPYFQHVYANPSSLHAFGQRVFEKIQEVRALIAEKIGCRADEILFTSSGTESNNLCIKGFANAWESKGRHLITSKIEHASVLETFAYLETKGFLVTYLDVDREGFVDPDLLRDSIRSDTILISIAHVNSEIGVIQPLEALIEAAGCIPFHTDAVQSFLKTDFHLQKYPVSLASFSGHKVHAPKGIGFVYKKSSLKVEALLHGGSQESGIRPGTENVPFIVGLGSAIQNFKPIHVLTMKELQRDLINALNERFTVRINGPRDLDRRVCTNVNLSFEMSEGEEILRLLSKEGIYVSTGSACSSKKSRISHVLKAIGCPPSYIHGNIRVGISKNTTSDEMSVLIKALSGIFSSQALCSLSVC